ncbi:MAG TPA: TlpA disulfide reductase family protein [Pseudonocardia sp.]|jgi:thiol-disulfide isomerase/thioredoxin
MSRRSRAVPVRAVSRAAAVLALLAALAGCSTGSDAVATGGDFQFVAPGNQTVIQYEPPEARGTLRAFAGDSLLHPGTQVGIQNFPGQVVVLNIWGSWCGPCRAEMADLQFVHSQTQVPGVGVLGVDIRDSQDAAADFVRDQKATYDSIFDPPGRSLLALNGYPRNVVPSTIVLDRRHRVASVYLTRIKLADLMDVVRRLAAEPRS